MFVCVFVCAYTVCVCACVRAWCVCVCVCVCVRVCAISVTCSDYSKYILNGLIKYNPFPCAYFNVKPQHF